MPHVLNYARAAVHTVRLLSKEMFKRDEHAQL